jgi:hypothetical protein
VTRSFYPPGPVAAAFLASSAPINIIEGPIESGKSTATAMRVYKTICQAYPDRDGKRRSRILITRNTYPDLRGSTVETFLDWFPPKLYGRFFDTEPYLYEMRFRDVVANIHFESYADDKDDTIRALRSKEYTAAWINEGQFFPRRLVFEIASRTGRYPKREDIAHHFPPGGGLQQNLMIDHNAPFIEDHWIRYMRGDIPIPRDMNKDIARQYAKPANVRFFRQPPALLEIMGPDGDEVIGYSVNPEAENLANMSDGIRSTVEMERRMELAKAGKIDVPRAHRYIELVGGKTTDEIERDLLGRVARVRRNATATPQFRRTRHVIDKGVKPVEGTTVVLCADHGLTPAVVFMQSINGCWIAFSELIGENIGTDEFAPLVRSHLATHYPWTMSHDGTLGGYVAWGDPQGGWRGSTATDAPFQLYAAHGIVMRAPAKKDRPLLRLEAARLVLRTEFNNRPRAQIHPDCPALIDALDGGAVIRKIKTADGMRMTEEIVKNSHSHVFDAWTYGLWGGGEVKEMIKPADAATRKTVTNVTKKRHVLTYGRRGR